MLKKFYYKIAEIKFKHQINYLGRNSQLRLNGRVIEGKYVHLESDVHIEKNWIIAVYPKFGGKNNPVSAREEAGIYIGERCSINRNLTIYCADSVKIGKDVLFGSYDLITDNDHGMNPNLDVPYYKQPLVTSPVSIGDGCWIAENVKILRGSIIGEKCIVAANSVVKGKFPAYSIIAGNPAKVIKKWNFEKSEWEKV